MSLRIQTYQWVSAEEMNGFLIKVCIDKKGTELWDQCRERHLRCKLNMYFKKDSE